MDKSPQDAVLVDVVRGFLHLPAMSSATVVSRALAIRDRVSSRGLVLSRHYPWTVDRVLPIFFASAAWVRPFASRAARRVCPRARVS